MTEASAFLKAILATPDDDLPRLVYADWLDEHSHPERAEFIRVQCELSRLTIENETPREIEPGGLTPTELNHWWAERATRGVYLREREWRLLDQHGPDWYLGFAVASHPEVGCATWSVEGPQPKGWIVCHGVTCVQHEPFSRGFVGRFTTQIRQWVGGSCDRCGGEGDLPASEAVIERTGAYTFACGRCSGQGHIRGVGPAVVASAPIERVDVSDREPMVNEDDDWVWYCLTAEAEGERAENIIHGLPERVFRHLKGGWQLTTHGRRYDTEADARKALSNALIVWAMSEPPARLLG